MRVEGRGYSADIGTSAFGRYSTIEVAAPERVLLPTPVIAPGCWMTCSQSGATLPVRLHSRSHMEQGYGLTSGEPWGACTLLRRSGDRAPRSPRDYSIIGDRHTEPGPSVNAGEKMHRRAGVKMHRERGQAVRHQTALSSSIDAPAFPSRPGNALGHGAQRRGWEERSHAQHREHGEHRTFPTVSTVAC